MSAYTSLVDQVHFYSCSIRNLVTLIQSSSFRSIYEAATQKERDAITTLIIKNQYLGIRKWYDDQRYAQLRFLTVRELRRLGLDLRIKDASILPKDQLERAVHAKRKNNG